MNVGYANSRCAGFSFRTPSLHLQLAPLASSVVHLCATLRPSALLGDGEDRRRLDLLAYVQRFTLGSFFFPAPRVNSQASIPAVANDRENLGISLLPHDRYAPSEPDSPGHSVRCVLIAQLDRRWATDRDTSLHQHCRWVFSACVSAVSA